MQTSHDRHSDARPGFLSRRSSVGRSFHSTRRMTHASSFLTRSASRLEDDQRSRIIVLIDDATNPATPESDANDLRTELVKLANLGGPSRRIARHHIAFAVRKRLKNDDPIVVLNAVKLLTGLMRVCPYFYRHIGEEKMFRRLWRLIVPDYKNSILSLLGRRKNGTDFVDADDPTQSEIVVRTLIMIRAWAEELSVMLNGKIDPRAEFLIERYNNKSRRMEFPEVPPTDLPWVCPVGPDATKKVSAVYEALRDDFCS